jgi:hypothetical protein
VKTTSFIFFFLKVNWVFEWVLTRFHWVNRVTGQPRFLNGPPILVLSFILFFCEIWNTLDSGSTCSFEFYIIVSNLTPIHGFFYDNITKKLNQFSLSLFNLDTKYCGLKQSFTVHLDTIRGNIVFFMRYIWHWNNNWGQNGPFEFFLLQYKYYLPFKA